MYISEEPAVFADKEVDYPFTLFAVMLTAVILQVRLFGRGYEKNHSEMLYMSNCGQSYYGKRIPLRNLGE